MTHATRRLAAIDIGTVTVRLLIADVSPGSVAEVERHTDITHLGEGLGNSGVVSCAAIGAVDVVMGKYVERIRLAGVESVTAFATSASRDAANADELLAVLNMRGVRPLVIDGAREAALSFHGATWGMDGSRALVDDIGGGSTELVLGEAATLDGLRPARIECARSVDVGSRRLTEAYLLSDPPTAAELEAARDTVTAELRPFFEMLTERPRMLVSVAGTATTLAAISMGLVAYDSVRVHGSRIGGQDVSGILEHLASMPLERRLRVPGLHPGRAPVIVGGALILETVMALAGVDSTLVSEHDILYGMLLEAYAAEEGS